MSSSPRTLRFVRVDGSTESPSLDLILKAVFEMLLPDLRSAADNAISTEIHHFGGTPGDGVEKIHRLSLGDSGAVQVAEDFHPYASSWTFEVHAPPTRIDAVASALREAAASQGLRLVA